MIVASASSSALLSSSSSSLSRRRNMMMRRNKRNETQTTRTRFNSVSSSGSSARVNKRYYFCDDVSGRRRPSPPPRRRWTGDDASHTVASSITTKSHAVVVATKATPEEEQRVTQKKPRLPAMDSVRFFLISYIAIGHFIACATKDPLLLKLLSQVNVVVGAFFVLSGYVAAYTASELNKYEHTEKRFLPTKVAYTIQRVMGYYPLYFATQILFMPVFLIADVTYNGWAKSTLHAALTFSLSQAWFPSHAELWNAPTWFLSALTFAFVVLPYALPSIAKLKRKGLQRLLVKLILLTCLVKFAYCYDVSGFGFFEGTMPPKTHPSWLFWNSVRFSPLFSTIDVLIGAVSARLVMIDGVENVPTNSVVQKPIIPLLLMIGLIVGRGYSIVSMSDAIARCIFVPLFAWFTMNIHRETVSTSPPPSQFSVSNVLSWKPLTYLGAISFPIYILHGPIGQIFYKRVVATKLFGFVFTSKPEFFPVWIGIVLVSAAIVNEVFLKNKKVQDMSKKVSNSLVTLSSN
mmetsp:Transcript_3384/g.10407  ORF Transcript_3384/g.10407 Transcript_3384/m.10407 type:complete len:518 (+) Transcript_3384:53-1606(+)